MLNQKAYAMFTFTSPWYFAALVDAVRSKSGDGQVCSVFTKGYRLNVSLRNGVMVLCPAEHRNNQWIAKPVSERLPALDTEMMLSSIEHLESYLRELFFTQWPQAEESFFEEFPSAEEIIQGLWASPVINARQAKRIFYTVQDDISVDEADGVVTILVKEGKLMAPFTRQVVDNEAVIRVQPERAKVHPAEPVNYYGEKFFTFFEKLASKVRSISWANLRDILERPFVKGE